MKNIDIFVFTKKRLVALFFIASLLSTDLLFSQAVKDSLTYNVGVNISGRRISGTFSQLVYGGGVKGIVESNKWILSNNLSYRFNETNGRKIEDNWYNLMTLFRYFNTQKTFYGGGFYHFDNNLIFRVNKRHRYGFGLGYLFGNTNTLRLEAGLGQEIAEFNGSDFINSDLDNARRTNGLFLLRVNNKYTLVKNKINFSYQVYYMQSLKEAADYDIWFTPKVSFNIAKGFSIYVNYDYRFENVYLEGLSDYNDILLFGLKWGMKG